MAPDPPASIWARRTPPRPPAPALTEAHSTDVAVIGGGLTGLSAAFHLAKAGHKVSLIEGRSIGFGGSGRNNGQVIPTLAAMEPAAMLARYGDRAVPFIHMVRDSAAYLFDFARAQGIECEAAQTGWFQPAHSPAYLRLSEARVAAWQAHGAPARLLDKPEGDALLGSRHWHGGMLNPTGGHINPLKLALGLARRCEEAGVQIFEHSPATFVTRHKSRWLVTTPEGRIESEAVLLATNAYTSQKLEPKIEREVVPLTAWQLATAPLPRAAFESVIPGRQAVSDTRGDLWYFRPTADGRLVTGAALLLPPAARPRLKRLLRQRLQIAFPQLGALDFAYIWNGYVGITADFTPRFHELGPGYFAFTGYNGRGLALSLSVGREMAAKISGQECALPFGPPRSIPLHGLVRPVARARLALTRLKDKQPPKV